MIILSHLVGDKRNQGFSNYRSDFDCGKRVGGLAQKIWSIRRPMMIAPFKCVNVAFDIHDIQNHGKK